MTPVRLCRAACIVMLAACAACAHRVDAQGITALSFDTLLHTHRLLRSDDEGQGVRVGVISGGASFYQTLLRQGILPSVAFYGGDASHGDEGDWMLQIVHRIAPRAQLAFCPGGSAEQTAACARKLVRGYHADIVVDDMNPQPVNEFPGYKDLAYSDLSRRHPNVLFFTGAGNNGGGYYEARWTPTPFNLDGRHYRAQDFGASMGRHSDPYERFRVPHGGGVWIVLGTNVNPGGQPARCSAGNPEVRLVLFDQFNQVLDSAQGRCPILQLSDPHPGSGSRSLRLAVLLSKDDRPKDLRLKLVTVLLGKQGVSPLALEYRTGGGAGNSATAPNLVAVTAVDPRSGWRQRYLYEAFANAGPQCMDYARSGNTWIRLSSPRCFHQPAFAAPDKMRVVMIGTHEDRYVPFSGDSAAGPAAAGVSALLLSAHIPARRIVPLLEQTAIPQTDVPGWNAHYGYGLIDADAAAVKAGVLPATRNTRTGYPVIPLFHRTPAFLQDRELALRARQGDTTALAQLRAEAQQGKADAQAWLAQYENGLGNEALAAHWAMAGARQGEPAAQSLLGSMYNHGWGVPIDPRAAQAWWWRAARRGMDAAIFNMGIMVADGRGAPADPALGYALMRAAFLRGMHFPAMFRAMARARLRIGLGRIAAAERRARRFAIDPGSIPQP